MTKLTITVVFSSLMLIGTSQSVDDHLSVEKMQKDLEVFKEIRIKANSGLYKHRTRRQIDSIYNWAKKEVGGSSTYNDFYNIICQLTDFEGSLHNGTYLPKKYLSGLKEESFGYFPYPIKWIQGKWLINYDGGEIPLGAEILTIDNIPISEVISSLYKYYTTDGNNLTGKRVGIRTNFPRYYRLNYGQKKEFRVSYKRHDTAEPKTKTISSISYSNYYKNFWKRHSKPIDQIYYRDLKEDEKYTYERIDSITGLLTIPSFAIGQNAEAKEHIKFAHYLDSIFTTIKEAKLKNLIVDIRYNGGGTDPNELVPYEYLTQRDFCENRSAWVSFKKIPYLKYIDTKVPRFLRPIGAIKYNKLLKKEFPIEKGGAYHQASTNKNRQIRKPRPNGFRGDIYLLINPEVASAGSNFASLVASNDNVTIIGEESMGGYYGHNGHTPMSYILPNTKLRTKFSIVNLEQYVIEKDSQIMGRGILPDYNITQTYEDFISNHDTQMKYTLNLINTK